VNEKLVVSVVVAMSLLVGLSIFSVATAEHSKTWYFGEGYVSDEVVEWLNILNPTNDDAHTTITLYYEDGRTEFFSKDIPADSKGGVKLNDYADAEKAFGTKIESDQPIVAQLAHYETVRGHGSIGSAELAKSWYFGEGYVSGEVVEWLVILNPSNDDAHTTITLYYEDGRTEFFSKDIPAHSKGGVKFNDYADAEKAFGTKIESDQPIVAQLVHYEPAGGHGSIGSTELAKNWYFGEGYVCGEVVEWIGILNPSNDDAHTTITLYYEDGRTEFFSKDIPAHSKGGVKLNDYADAGKAFGTKIESDQPVVVQLAHYEPAGGHGSIGSTELARTWYFGEGYVSGEVVEWLNILNPTNDDAHTTITLYYEDGRTEFFSKDIPAHSKGGVKLNDYADAGKAFGTRIDSDQPIVVQLAHYEPAGGHGSIGAILREVIPTPTPTLTPTLTPTPTPTPTPSPTPTLTPTSSPTPSPTPTPTTTPILTPIPTLTPTATPSPTPTPDKKKGSIDVSTKPSNASVYLDGDYKGKTPLTIPNVSLGHHTIKLEKEDYPPYEERVMVSADGSVTVTKDLEKVWWKDPPIIVAIIGIIICAIIGVIGLIMSRREKGKKGGNSNSQND